MRSQKKNNRSPRPFKQPGSNGPRNGQGGFIPGAPPKPPLRRTPTPPTEAPPAPPAGDAPDKA